MTSSELRTLFEAARPYLEAWGEYVKDVVAEHFKDARSAADSDFFAVPPHSRVKKTGEFVAKSRREGKTYHDPWVQITDKVGTRFVTLLASDAKLVCEFIANYAGWTASHDLDHEAQKSRQPEHFLYASEHYVVRPKETLTFKGATIPVEAACEIQVRTLLEHGYSELTHNTLYKGALAQDPVAKRKAARSMALIETTDQIFEEVVLKAQEVTRPLKELYAQLEAFWRDAMSPEPILNSLGPLILDDLAAQDKSVVELGEKVIDFFTSDKSHLDGLNAKHGELFGMPIALLLVYLAHERPRLVANSEVLSPAELETLDGLTGAGLFE